jgi:hypothetical protein
MCQDESREIWTAAAEKTPLFFTHGSGLRNPRSLTQRGQTIALSAFQNANQSPITIRPTIKKVSNEVVYDTIDLPLT